MRRLRCDSGNQNAGDSHHERNTGRKSDHASAPGGNDGDNGHAHGTHILPGCDSRNDPSGYDIDRESNRDDACGDRDDIDADHDDNCRGGCYGCYGYCAVVDRLGCTDRGARVHDDLARCVHYRAHCPDSLRLERYDRRFDHYCAYAPPAPDCHGLRIGWCFDCIGLVGRYLGVRLRQCSARKPSRQHSTPMQTCSSYSPYHDAFALCQAVSAFATELKLNLFSVNIIDSGSAEMGVAAAHKGRD